MSKFELCSTYRSFEGNKAQLVNEALCLNDASSRKNKVDIRLFKDSAKFSVTGHQQKRFIILEVSPSEICRKMIDIEAGRAEIITYQRANKLIIQQNQKWEKRSGFAGNPHYSHYRP